MIGNEKGNCGENLAAVYLEKNGYLIIARNYHSTYGEIDIVAVKNENIVFAEVKLRKKNSRVNGLESVSKSKQKKIVLTSALFLQDFPSDLQPRYDVLSVRDFENGDFSVEHIENAFDTQDIFY